MNISLAVIFAAIVALYILSFVYEKSARLLNTVAVALHILSLFPLLYFSAPLEALLAVYMTSLALRSLIFLVLNKIKGVRK